MPPPICAKAGAVAIIDIATIPAINIDLIIFISPIYK
jgi:hypothetical protein